MKKKRVPIIPVSGLGIRLSEFNKIKGLNKNTLSESLGIKQNSVVTRIVNNRNPEGGMSFDTLQRFMRKFPDVNPRWLILGEEYDMFEVKDKKPTLIVTETVNIEKINNLQHTITTQERTIQAQEKTIQLLEAKVRQLEG